MTVAERLKEINLQIRAHEKTYGREPNSVKLLAVSKGQPIAKIEEAIANGQCLFGENYLQEALDKMSHLTNANLAWHFIGTIQRNKTRKIAEHFSWVHAVDNIHIAERLNEQRPNYLPPLNVCIEVNLDNEPQKSGVAITDILVLAKQIAALPHLTLRGLMAIPKPVDIFSEQRASYHRLTLLFERLNAEGFALDTLSAGMSHDFEAAIAEGATIVRIGTGVFGPRE